MPLPMDSWRPAHRPVARPRTSRPDIRKWIPAAALVVALAGGYGAYAYLGGASSRASAEAEESLALAKALCDRGEPARALAVLDMMEQRNLRTGESGDWLRVRAAKELGQTEKAGQAASAFLSRHPRSEHAPEAELIALSAQVAAKGVADAATRSTIEGYLSTNAGSKGAASLEAELGLQEVRDGRVAEAAARFDRLFATIPDDPRVRELGRAIGEANMRALLDGTLPGAFETHKVAKGEAVAKIAKKYGVTPELLLRVNGIDDPRRLQPGQELRVPRVDWSLHCDVGANLLLLRNAGTLFKAYDVRTGRDPGATPKGTYKVLNKKQNPTWRPGDGRIYLPGDPNNELGTRWMSFQGDILGIHGTIHDETIGSYASNGCIGMTRGDVEELFDLVQVGTPLTITGEQDPSRHRILPKPDVPPPQQQVARR